MDPNRKNQARFQYGKYNLESGYAKIKEGKLDSLWTDLDRANKWNKHKESWRLINNLIGQKPTKQGLIKGNSRKQNWKKWYNNSTNFKAPQIPDQLNEADLPKTLGNLATKDTEFTIDKII